MLSLLLPWLLLFSSGNAFTYPMSKKNGWAELCLTGKAQSPIDIDGTTVEREHLQLHYNTPAKFVNNAGLNMQMTMEGEVEKGEKLYFVPPGEDGKKFYLKQFHLHTMSEHTRNGVSFPIEVHFVHVADDGKIAVVAVFMQFGAENRAYEAVLNNFHKTGKDAEQGTAFENPIEVFGNSPLNRYWTYTGSLTTPPCSEGVLWHVLEFPATLSKAQFDKIVELRGTTDKSNRVVMPLNGRQIDNGCACTCTGSRSRSGRPSGRKLEADDAAPKLHMSTLRVDEDDPEDEVFSP